MLNKEESELLKHLIGLHSDRHHLTPKSRQTRPDHVNVIKVSRVAHLAYHILFGNALPEEAVQILKKYWTYKEVDETIELSDNCRYYYKRE